MIFAKEKATPTGTVESGPSQIIIIKIINHYFLGVNHFLRMRKSRDIYKDASALWCRKFFDEQYKNVALAQENRELSECVATLSSLLKSKNDTEELRTIIQQYAMNGGYGNGVRYRL